MCAVVKQQCSSTLALIQASYTLQNKNMYRENQSLYTKGRIHFLYSGYIEMMRKTSPDTFLTFHTWPSKTVFTESMVSTQLMHALNNRSTMSYKVIIRLDLTNLGYSSTLKALLSKIISLLMRFSPISLIKITLKDVPLLLFKWMGENGGCFKSCLPVISGWISLVKGMILPGKSFYNEKT